MSTFDAVSHSYAAGAVVQQDAARKLITLLGPTGREDILDLACGPGHLTALLREQTAGRVAGIDVSQAMVDRARAAYPSIEFRCGAAEDLEFRDEFDVVFCNSSFQWFTDPRKVLAGIRWALRPGGRVGISCPATAEFTPFFSKAAAAVAADPEIKWYFERWRNPWFVLPALGDYRQLFEGAGFETVSLEAPFESTLMTVERAFAVYLSGAANGFTRQEFYGVTLPPGYADIFNKKMREAFEASAASGMVAPSFTRLYYVGKK